MWLVSVFWVAKFLPHSTHLKGHLLALGGVTCLVGVTGLGGVRTSCFIFSLSIGGVNGLGGLTDSWCILGGVRASCLIFCLSITGGVTVLGGVSASSFISSTFRKVTSSKNGSGSM